MKTINTKNQNVIVCDCGNVIEFDKTDYILQKTDESGAFYAIGVKCPACGCLHVKNPEDFDGNALISTLKGARKPMSECSWEEIKEACEAYRNGGDVPSAENEAEVLPFKVGEEKEIELENGDKVAIVFIGRNRFLERGTGKRQPLVFNFKDLIGTDDGGGNVMNDECTNAGGWEASKMRKWLNDDVFGALPSALQSCIKTVSIYTVNKGKKPTATEDKLFLLSEVEVFGKSERSANGEGEQFAYFEDWHHRIKGYTDGGYGRWWWLRSPRSGNSGNFVVVSYDGSVGTNGANGTYGVSPCFAI